MRCSSGGRWGLDSIPGVTGSTGAAPAVSVSMAGLGTAAAGFGAGCRFVPPPFPEAAGPGVPGATWGSGGAESSPASFQLPAVPPASRGVPRHRVGESQQTVAFGRGTAGWGWRNTWVCGPWWRGVLSDPLGEAPRLPACPAGRVDRAVEAGAGTPFPADWGSQPCPRVQGRQGPAGHGTKLGSSSSLGSGGSHKKSG